MRPLIYQTLMTLDGYVGGPKGELDWHIITPDMHEVYNATQREIGGYIMGRKTYEVMRGWDELGGKPGDAPQYRGFHEGWVELPKLVFSGSLRSVGPNARIATGTAADEIAALKAELGKPLAINGAGLVASLAGTGLIDEYILFVHPALLGGGTPALPPGERTNLRLVESHAFPSGVVRLRYVTQS